MTTDTRWQSGNQNGYSCSKPATTKTWFTNIYLGVVVICISVMGAIHVRFLCTEVLPNNVLPLATIMINVGYNHTAQDFNLIRFYEYLFYASSCVSQRILTNSVYQHNYSGVSCWSRRKTLGLYGWENDDTTMMLSLLTSPEPCIEVT